MAQSVLEAIRHGNWKYEPITESPKVGFDATNALPGSEQKLAVMAERIRKGLPLWHPQDRLNFGPHDDE